MPGILVINGSPRKNGTTATLLKKAIDGAASEGSATEYIRLNQLNMRGCQGCYSCKKRGGESLGKCVLKDDMTPLYDKIEQSDAMIIGSPIYFSAVTSECKMFFDRLFPYLNYGNYSTNFPKRIPVGLVFTMGADDEQMKMLYEQYIQVNQMTLSFLFGSAETLISTDTFHVPDYSEIIADVMETLVEKKLEHQREVFPQDCKKAFDMGARFAKLAKTK
ncbi:MAG: flavodoxin family protein [Chloroflexota bacterium]|nr:flavodoxin family protein [Chloroflexota bacterium]